jgi:hypothetical protein
MKWLPLLTGLALLATACAQSGDRSTAQSGQVDCATAEADLRILRSEQSHVMQEQQAGGRGTTMVPSGLVTEPEFRTGPVDAGEYGDYLGDRISQIEQACGL